MLNCHVFLLVILYHCLILLQSLPFYGHSAILQCPCLERLKKTSLVTYFIHEVLLSEVQFRQSTVQKSTKHFGKYCQEASAHSDISDYPSPHVLFWCFSLVYLCFSLTVSSLFPIIYNLFTYLFNPSIQIKQIQPC